MSDTSLIVKEVTGLYPVAVAAIQRPASVDEVVAAVRTTTGPISIGGGRFSMGGQTASPGSLHLDMRGLNQVLAFSAEHRTIRVQAGIRWCDIQRLIDPHGLAVKIMQTYANFTVGGALSVNCHGRYVGQGPVILSVRALRLVLADGSVADTSPTQNPDLFYGAIGGYGGLGIIVEAELDLVENTRVVRISAKMRTADYRSYFQAHIRNAADAIFHNGDLYPPHYDRVRAVTWKETAEPASHRDRLQQPRADHAVDRYAMWAISETPLGRWRREHIYEPLIYGRRRVHWRNYEAGYDVAELEPRSRDRATYVLQEYFVPVDGFDAFVPVMGDILRRHRVNVINVSIRHARPDPGSLLAWARQECFAFVLYYKQGTDQPARDRVAIWTRELIDAALAAGGTYYLPYQPHATPEQFHAAYPRADEYFALKHRLDPAFRFRNALWNKYFPKDAMSASSTPVAQGCFHAVYSDDRARDGFFAFLRNIFHLYPEDRFHALITSACVTHQGDEQIYRQIQAGLPGIKPFLADLFYGLPALATQKREMAAQTAALLGDRGPVDGYVEIGSTGRYVGGIRKRFGLRGPVYLVNDVAPTNAPPDIIERGRLRPIGTFVPLADYDPIPAAQTPDASVDLVSCYIGLHHCPPGKLAAFLASIHRVLRPGGTFLVRDHDVDSPAMDTFVALAHIVFNAGLGTPWETNSQELRFFAPVARWSERLAAAGFRDIGERLAQPGDPTRNQLMAFIKQDGQAK